MITVTSRSLIFRRLWKSRRCDHNRGCRPQFKTIMALYWTWHLCRWKHNGQLSMIRKRVVFWPQSFLHFTWKEHCILHLKTNGLLLLLRNRILHTPIEVFQQMLWTCRIPNLLLHKSIATMLFYSIADKECARYFYHKNFTFKHTALGTCKCMHVHRKLEKSSKSEDIQYIYTLNSSKSMTPFPSTSAWFHRSCNCWKHSP